MASILPLKLSSQATIVELAHYLLPHFGEISQAWRRKMDEEFAFDERILGVLERLTIPTAYKLFYNGNFGPFFENLNYFGVRLAKLQVDTRAVARALEFGSQVCEPYLRSFPPEKCVEIVAALEALTSASFVTVSGAFFDTQRKESAALVSVLDAELSARDLEALLGTVLAITVKTFSGALGMIMLRDGDGDMLRIKAAVGFQAGELDEDVGVPIGAGFSGSIAKTGEPAVLPDISESKGILNPALREKAKALWGVPLKSGDRVIGVILIGFTKPYDWLPTERELLRAIADRSALAIERARITDALREREMRIAELSAHLLKVTEDERKRISRELHDETGQALMVIRLYLGMLESTVTARTAKGKIRETLSVVDRTIEGLRRIIARLSPLVLQELGLVAAIRKEAKDLAKSTGVKARVAISDDLGRLNPDVEAAIYRVVQEALHNVAKHAQAKTVNIQMTRDNGEAWLVVEDDGVGFNPNTRTRTNERQTFGLAGIRERIGMLGGKVNMISAKGKGTRIEITVPAPPREESAVVHMPQANTRAAS